MSPDDRRVFDLLIARTALAVVDGLVLVSLSWLAWLGLTFIASLLTSPGVPT